MDLASAAPSPALRQQINVYTGSQDRLIMGQRLLATLLAADHVVEVPGDHDWPAWNVLWSRWLARAPWPQRVTSRHRGL